MREYKIALLVIMMVAPGLSLGQMTDSAGNFATDVRAGQAKLGVIAEEPGNIGEVIDSFPNPSALRGLTFREDKLWGVTAGGLGGTGPGVLYEMDADDGTVLSTINISPTPEGVFGLGYDTKRGVFIVTVPAGDESQILTVDPTTGSVISSFDAPGSGPVGAAYDSTRDGYWIADWITDRLSLISSETGEVISSLPVPSGASRIAGAGYDAINDVIVFNSRDNAQTYLVSATDGGQVGVFPTPPSPDVNNGQGAAIRPTDLTGYLTNFEVQTIFVVDLGLSMARMDHFVCYEIEPVHGRKHKHPQFKPLEVLIHNQFGEQRYRVVEPDTLCVPSSKELVH